MKRYTILAFLLSCLSPLFAQEWERQHPFEDLRDALDVGMAPNGFGVLVGREGLLMQTEDFGQNWTYAEGNFSGSLREAACTPNGDGTYTTWVAGVTLWRSPDEGQSWEEVDYPQGFGNASYLNVLQPDELFVGNAVSLFKTEDGGSSWAAVKPDSLDFITNFFFLNSEHGWVGDRDGHVFITQDGGESWDKATIAEGLEEFVGVLFRDELNGYASLREDFYQTADGGYTWEKIADNAFGNRTDALVFSSADQQSIAATSFDRRVYQSQDGGLTWSRLTAGDGFVYGLDALPDGQVWVASEFRSVYYTEPGQFFQNQIPGIRDDLQEIAFLNLDYGWAVGQDAALKTTDGGENWAASNFSDFTGENSLKQVLVLSEQEVWLLGNRAIYRTLDGGISWETRYEIPDNRFNFGLEKAGNSIMAVSSDGAVHRTEDEGATWESIAIEGVERLRDLTFASDEVGYAIGYQSNLAKTTDGGNTWLELSSDLPENLNLVQVSFVNPDTGWIVNRGLADHIWKTEDGGMSWTPSTVAANSYWQSINFVNDTLGFVCGGSSIVGKVYQTTDAGQSWSEVHSIDTRINNLSFASDETTRRIWIAGLGGNIERQENDITVNSTHQASVKPLVFAPNPASDLLQLQLPTGLSPNAQLEIYNNTGQLIWRKPATPLLQLGDWPAGLYIVRLTDGQNLYQAKVIKTGNP